MQTIVQLKHIKPMMMTLLLRIELLIGEAMSLSAHWLIGLNTPTNCVQAKATLIIHQYINISVQLVQ